MQRVREFIGGFMILAGLMEVFVATQVDKFAGADAYIVSGFALVLVGYCLQGWDPPDAE